jgi:hypothetical protein
MTNQTTISDAQWESMNFAVYVLGAGFSVPAGLPLATELWKEVRLRAQAMNGRASMFEDDLKDYLEFKRKCDGVELTEETVNFEEFLGFLDVEHYLGLRGKDTWSEDGNETQVLVKTLIAQILVERTPGKNQIPDLYLRFAEKLKPEDLVITFNYDVLLERALEVAGTPFRLFTERHANSSSETLIVDSTRQEAIVLKVHGSVDWFDRRSYRQMEESYQRHGISEPPRSPVFNAGLRLAPLLEGPRFRTDPLKEVYRLFDVDRFYRNPPIFQETPVLLNPSPAKLLYSDKFLDFWWGLGRLGSLNFRMAVIGFSLPVHDDYSRQILYRIITNYQGGEYWDQEFMNSGKRKRPLVLVDLRKSESGRNDYLKRYSFVDCSRADICLNGFDESVIAKL